LLPMGHPLLERERQLLGTVALRLDREPVVARAEPQIDRALGDRVAILDHPAVVLGTPIDDRDRWRRNRQPQATDPLLEQRQIRLDLLLLPIALRPRLLEVARVGRD